MANPSTVDYDTVLLALEQMPARVQPGPPGSGAETLSRTLAPALLGVLLRRLRRSDRSPRATDVPLGTPRSSTAALGPSEPIDHCAKWTLRSGSGNLRSMSNDGSWCMRFFHSGVVAFAWPVQPVEHTAGVVAVGLAAGTRGLAPIGYPDDKELLDNQALEGEFRHVERTWESTHCLHVHRPDQWWGTRLMWDAATGDFLCWYVDFLRPVHCHGTFLDTRDLALDIVVRPDGTITWKDEDRYAHKISIGLIDDEERSNVERARKVAMSAIERNAFPFDGTYLDWRPDGIGRVLPHDALVVS